MPNESTGSASVGSGLAQPFGPSAIARDFYLHHGAPQSQGASLLTSFVEYMRSKHLDPVVAKAVQEELVHRYGMHGLSNALAICPSLTEGPRDWAGNDSRVGSAVRPVSRVRTQSADQTSPVKGHGAYMDKFRDRDKKGQRKDWSMNHPAPPTPLEVGPAPSGSRHSNQEGGPMGESRLPMTRDLNKLGVAARNAVRAAGYTLDSFKKIDRRRQGQETRNAVGSGDKLRHRLLQGTPGKTPGPRRLPPTPAEKSSRSGGLHFEGLTRANDGHGSAPAIGGSPLKTGPGLPGGEERPVKRADAKHPVQPLRNKAGSSGVYNAGVQTGRPIPGGPISTNEQEDHEASAEGPGFMHSRPTGALNVPGAPVDPNDPSETAKFVVTNIGNSLMEISFAGATSKHSIFNAEESVRSRLLGYGGSYIRLATVISEWITRRSQPGQQYIVDTATGFRWISENDGFARHVVPEFGVV